MMRISVWHNDLSESYLRQISQLGADCVDCGQGDFFPGVKEQGYPDLDELLKLKKRVHSFGLEFNRVTLPDLGPAFMQDTEGGEVELDNACKSLEVFAAAGMPLARQRFAGDTFPQLMRRYHSQHRGGYLARGESLDLASKRPQTPSPEELDTWRQRFRLAYGRLVPIAEENDIRLALHPSDTPNLNTPLDGLGYHRVIDDFPSRHVGYLYCCGTRAEAGGGPLIMDEIHNYGRKGRIFMVHLRNVRGSLATANAFEETLLDDGDINPFKVLLELRRIGFDGCINPDHIPAIEGDSPQAHHGLAYSIGYLRAMLAALAVV
jgi:mannonate dehydratase